jgi:murein tripeptide amidase MpaA
MTLLFVILSLVVFINADYKTFHNDKVLRLEVTKEDDLRYLADEYENNRDLDFWTEPFRLGNVDVRVTPEVYPIFTQKLTERGIHFEIMISNVQELVEAQLQRDNTTAPNAFSLTQYNEWQDIQDYMDEFAAANPSMATVITVGRSYGNRDIRGVKLTAGNTRKPYVIWIQAGIHAREWIAPATCLWMMTHSLDQFASDWAPIYQQAEVIWIPNLNPDGYIYTRTTDRMWRKTRRPNTGSTCVGTDPNRNYPVGYGRNDGSSPQPCSETYRGPAFYSEPEIRTTTSTLTNIANSQTVVGFMDLHSYSQLWLAPWGYITANTQDAAAQNSLGQAATAALRSWYGTSYTYGPIAQVLYTASGGSVDWAYGELGIVHSYTPELRDTGSYGFILPPSQITPSGEETSSALLVWAQRSLSLAMNK